MTQETETPTLTGETLEIPGAATIEADDAATSTPETEIRPLAPAATPDAGGFFLGTGRRKASVARVRIKAGDGKFMINDKELDNYFHAPQHLAACKAAVEATETTGKIDIHVNAHGGGMTGQSEAILLGLARALKGYDPSLEPTLREHGFLSRDPRRVERKKYGQRGARRRFQFSKR